MHNEFLKKAQKLNEGKEAYATAIIVRRKIPSSGKPGDKAIITKDGQIHGWIGGGCTRGIVLKESLLAIQESKARLISISPDASLGHSSYSKTYSMTCQSGGEVDVYIEPVLPKPHIIIFGTSHIAMALSKVAKAMSYQVSCVVQDADKNIFPEADQLINISDFTKAHASDNSHVVVCTQGEGDAEALFKAIALGNDYLAFVASRKKANAIFNDLRKMGASFDQLKKIKTPAGLDINAKLPEEVAISILAQIIEDFRSKNSIPAQNEGKFDIQNDDFYMNPVCKIPIQKSTAKHVIEHKGEQVYFCCDGCKVSFEKSPETYLPLAKIGH